MVTVYLLRSSINGGIINSQLIKQVILIEVVTIRNIAYFGF